MSKVQDFLGDVLICKIEPMHESKHKRLCAQVVEQHAEAVLEQGEIKVAKRNALTSATMWPVVKKVLAKDKAFKPLQGVAPMGANARRTQKLLDAMPEEMEEK